MKQHPTYSDEDQLQGVGGHGFYQVTMDGSGDKPYVSKKDLNKALVDYSNQLVDDGLIDADLLRDVIFYIKGARHRNVKMWKEYKTETEGARDRAVSVFIMQVCGYSTAQMANALHVSIHTIYNMDYPLIREAVVKAKITGSKDAAENYANGSRQGKRKI